MPIVKRNAAHYDSSNPVFLADVGSKTQPDDVGANRPGSAEDDSRVEVVRAANGDITRINVRCDCGQMASLQCEYES